MEQDVEPTVNSAARSSAAERMRRSRERRRDGTRCLWVELGATEIAALIRRGFLRADARNNKDAVLEALHAHLQQSLDDNPWHVT
jgi:hypothetical protein